MAIIKSLALIVTLSHKLSFLKDWKGHTLESSHEILDK